jgi:hypothetical protein
VLNTSLSAGGKGAVPLQALLYMSFMSAVRIFARGLLITTCSHSPSGASTTEENTVTYNRSKYITLSVKLKGEAATQTFDCYGWMVKDNMLCLQDVEGNVYKVFNMNSVIEFNID